MKIRSIALISAACFAGSTPARDKTDIIMMQNGDRMTGEIKGLDSGVLRVDLDYADGAVSLSWLKVARVDSSQLFLVHTQEGKVYSGTIKTLENPGGKLSSMIQVVESAESRMSIDQSRVVKVEPTSEAFLKRLTGDINFGSSFSKGNSTNQYNLGMDIEYLQERWGIETDYSSNLSASTGATTATRNQVNLFTYRLMPRSNYFYAGLGGFLQSSVQSIDRQTNFGGGIGRFIKNTNRMRFSVLGGAIWQETEYRQDIVPASVAREYGGVASTDLKVNLFKKTNLSVTATVVPAISDRGRVFYSTNGSYYLKFFRDFSWNFSFYGNWDSRPPPHLSGGDYGYSSGLKWTFNK